MDSSVTNHKKSRWHGGFSADVFNQKSPNMFKTITYLSRFLSNPQNLFPVCMGLFVTVLISTLLLASCKKPEVHETKKKAQSQSRVILVEETTVNGYSFAILKDTKTGEEYLSSCHGGIVKLAEGSDQSDQ